MKIKVELSIGTIHNQTALLDVDDAELEGLSQAAQHEVIQAYTDTWANNYIEFWYEIVND